MTILGLQVLHGGVSMFSRLASQRRQLENKRLPNIPIGKAKRILKALERDANASGHADSAQVDLFRRVRHFRAQFPPL